MPSFTCGASRPSLSHLVSLTRVRLVMTRQSAARHESVGKRRDDGIHGQGFGRSQIVAYGHGCFGVLYLITFQSSSAVYKVMPRFVFFPGLNRCLLALAAWVSFVSVMGVERQETSRDGFGALALCRLRALSVGLLGWNIWCPARNDVMKNARLLKKAHLFLKLSSCSACPWRLALALAWRRFLR